MVISFLDYSFANIQKFFEHNKRTHQKKRQGEKRLSLCPPVPISGCDGVLLQLHEYLPCVVKVYLVFRFCRNQRALSNRKPMK